jgi:hypothetical protein
MIINQDAVIPIWAYVGRFAISRQETDIIIVVKTTVDFLPRLSPSHPKKTAPTGLRMNVEQKAKAERRAVVWGSVFGKNSSFKRMAM